MPVDRAASHSHKVFPPARTRKPKGGGGFRSNPMLLENTNNSILPAVEHATTALLFTDIENERIKLESPSRFTSFVRRKGPLSFNKEGDNNTIMSSKSNNKVNQLGQPSIPGLVSSFDAALDAKKREEQEIKARLRKNIGDSEDVGCSTMDTCEKIEFDTLKEYQQWTEDTVDVFMKELRKQILIAKPDSLTDYTIQFCVREAMGQPHPSAMASMNRSNKNDDDGGGGGGGGGRRTSVLGGNRRVSMHRRYAHRLEGSSSKEPPSASAALIARAAATREEEEDDDSLSLEEDNSVATN